MEKKMDFRIEKTYLSLHNAFTFLLEEKRFEEITVNELCRHAMIRRTTFYKHFADKYEYFRFYIKEICSSFQDQLPPDIMPGNLNSYFLYMCQELLHFMKTHEKLIANCFQSNLLSTLLEILGEHIAFDILQVLSSKNIDKKMSRSQMEGIAAFYSDGLLNVLSMYYQKREAIDERKSIQVITELLGRDTTAATAL